jgi:hypothetical protein
MVCRCYNNCRRNKTFDKSSINIDIILNMLHECEYQKNHEIPTIIDIIFDKNIFKKNINNDIDLVVEWIRDNRNTEFIVTNPNYSFNSLFNKIPNNVYQKLLSTLSNLMNKHNQCIYTTPYIFVNTDDFIKLKRILIAIDLLVTL